MWREADYLDAPSGTETGSCIVTSGALASSGRDESLAEIPSMVLEDEAGEVVALTGFL